MLKLILNLALLVILALCIWGGFKRGLIGGVAGFLAALIAIVGANAISSAYSRELVPALSPFVGGYIDSETTTDQILSSIGYGGTDLSLDDILTQDTSLRYDYAYESLRSIGFCRVIAEEQANESVGYANRMGITVTEAVITMACNTIAYVGLFVIAFIMILILITAAMDILNVDFHLPNVEVLDEVAGAAMGFVRGFLYCVLACWVLGFLGMLIGRDTCDTTPLISFFQAFRFITRSLI
jgi:hypothetical protein